MDRGNQEDRSGVIHQSLGYWATLLSRTMEADFNKRLAGHSVTRVAWAVLSAIAFDEVATPSDLARFLQMDRAAITRLLDKLEALGLVLRYRRHEDGRVIALKATPAGKAMAAELLQMSKAVNEKFTAELSPQEADQFISTIKKMLACHQTSNGTL